MLRSDSVSRAETALRKSDLSESSVRSRPTAVLRRTGSSSSVTASPARERKSATESPFFSASRSNRATCIASVPKASRHISSLAW